MVQRQKSFDDTMDKWNSRGGLTTKIHALWMLGRPVSWSWTGRLLTEGSLVGELLEAMQEEAILLADKALITMRSATVSKSGTDGQI